MPQPQVLIAALSAQVLFYDLKEILIAKEYFYSTCQVKLFCPHFLRSLGHSASVFPPSYASVFYAVLETHVDFTTPLREGQLLFTAKQEGIMELLPLCTGGRCEGCAVPAPLAQSSNVEHSTRSLCSSNYTILPRSQLAQKQQLTTGSHISLTACSYKFWKTMSQEESSSEKEVKKASTFISKWEAKKNDLSGILQAVTSQDFSFLDFLL